jgi:hypothetical protein
VSPCERGSDVDFYKVENAEDKTLAEYYKKGSSNKQDPPKEGYFKRHKLSLSLIPSL